MFDMFDVMDSVFPILFGLVFCLVIGMFIYAIVTGVKEKRANDAAPVLTVEALAQAGAVAILSMEANKGKIAYFGGINKCKFKGKIVPGDKVRLETKIIKQKGPVGVGEAIASVDGKTVVSAELTFMIG